MRKIFISTGLFLIFFSCNHHPLPKQNQSLLQEMKWLIGTWKNVSADGELYEVWNTSNDSVFSGIGFMILKGDTLFSEVISLEARNGELIYMPSVTDQNDGLPVQFKLTSHTGNEFIFENKEHDFPQRIIYNNPNSDSLYARVEGMQNGEFRKEEFSMSREK